MFINDSFIAGNNLKIKSVIFSLIIFGFNQYGMSVEKWHKWDRFSGTWTVKDSKAVESRGWGPGWEVYNLINYNTLVTIDSFDDLSSIEVNAELFDRLETPSELMISFAVTSESKKWFYHNYAFKLEGGFWGLNKASLILSDRLDRTQPLSVKHNFFVKEIASADCRVKYNKLNKYRVSFEGTDVILYINEDKVLSVPFPEKTHGGHVGISTRNIKISLNKVEVKQNDKVIFDDDFDRDSIFVDTVKATREPTPKKETEKKLE